MSTWFSIKITINNPSPQDPFVFNGYMRTTQNTSTEYTITGFFPSNNGTFVNDNKLIHSPIGGDNKIIMSDTFSFTNQYNKR
jgi:hypothetical protein